MARERERTRRLVRRVGAAEAGRTLLDVLVSWAPAAAGFAVPRARLRALIAAGAAHVDGLARRSPGLALRAGAKVDVRLRLEALVAPTSRTDRPFVLDAASILYQDEWLIAVDKPWGLPTHATADPRRASLVAAVEAYLAATGRRAYVAVHQRLDRDTSGVVLFATDPAANDGLARAFAGRQVEKTYLALARAGSESGRAAGAAGTLTIEAALSVSDQDGRVRVGGPGAKPATTEVTLLESLPGLLLLEARPSTGRKHQVRAHLAHAGLPILGDAVYGRVTADAPRLMLHAARLVLPHPLSGWKLVLESPLPADFALFLARARSEAAPASAGRRARR